MIPIVTFLVVLSVSILVTRVASVALMLTGLSRETARFQARSAFTGVGYTTSETEKIVNHPVRRRIVMILMLWGNVGLITVISTVVITFVQQGDRMDQWWKLLLLAGGAAVLWIVAMSKKPMS